jgi:hypothetical protein
VIAVAIGLVRGAPAVEESKTTVGRAKAEQPSVAVLEPSRDVRCPEPLHEGPEVAEPDGRSLLLELQKAKAESTLAELGAMPMEWAQVADVPAGLLPDRFEALVARAVTDLGLTVPDIDCSEFPCVVIAPDAWTSEQFVALRDVVRREADVEDAKLFGVDHGSARVFGVYSEGTVTPELLGRIWFRVREVGREAGPTTGP